MAFESAFELFARSFTLVTTLQGAVIALFVAFLMTRYTRILYFSFLAILIDQFLAVLHAAYRGRDFDQLAEQASSIAGSLEIDVIVVRFVGYLILISLFFFAKNILFNRD